MRVALDATPLTLTSGGLARYTADLHEALVRQFPEDEYRLMHSGPGRWWLLGIQKQMTRQSIDIFHGTNFAVPYLPMRPSVLTLHDLSPWMERAWHHNADRVRQRTPYLLKLGIATMVITDSEAVRRQAIEYFGLAPQRVAAIPLAAHERFRPVAAPNPNPYFLFAGTLEPRKNIPFLIEAWRPVHAKTGVELLMAGRRRADFAEPSPEPGLRFLGEVQDERLPELYSNARAVVYPSLYEGFGLPVLEAMQCGAVVITSTDPSIHEVCGDAAMRLDPKDARAWTEALLACASGAEWFEVLRDRALRRASEFSWQRTATLTRSVYQEAQERFA
ncbi:MAG: glycosyltransferase family 4 protein [Bryobacteraceae bacterium]